MLSLILRRVGLMIGLGLVLFLLFYWPKLALGLVHNCDQRKFSRKITPSLFVVNL